MGDRFGMDIPVISAMHVWLLLGVRRVWPILLGPFESVVSRQDYPGVGGYPGVLPRGVGVQRSSCLACSLWRSASELEESWNSWQNCWSEISLGPSALPCGIGAVSEEQWCVVLGL